MTDPSVEPQENSGPLNAIDPSEGLRLMKAFLAIESTDDKVEGHHSRRSTR